MTNRKKEFAKFFSGAASFAVLVHLELAFSDVLPLKLIGGTLTPLKNGVAIAFWFGLANALIYYAWSRD